jgi:ubiquinone/menaquinone biosynthesis C-methylase UbiE
MSKKYLQEEHPLIKGELAESFPSDQFFSVEASLDSMIPWINYIDSIKDKDVFVFGTGLGGTTVACAMNVGNGTVCGVDISKKAIHRTELRAALYGVKDKVKLKHLESTYPLPFEDDSFDISFIADVLEHIVDERGKYVREVYRITKKNGLIVITGTPNLIYPKDSHTTNLYFIPWMTSETAYKYAVFRKRWKKGENLDYAGRKGATYWNIKKWLRGCKYEILNLKSGFTSDYLSANNRLHTYKRKLLFKPYKITEIIMAKVFRTPITAIMPYINHLFIRKTG